MTIPRTIHQIWVGDKPMPVQWMITWTEKHPDFAYHLWTEKEIDGLGLINRKKYDYFMAKKDYAGAADIARVEILYQFGGVYVDADSICLQPIDDLLACEFFAGFEYDRRIANGTIGAIAQHPILREYLVRIMEATILDPACYTIGGTLLTSCVDACGRGGVNILPQHAFYPKIKQRAKYEATGAKIYAKHIFGSTKNSYGK
jgi:mannosyltransferase OCH1-like enzyme